MVTISKVRNALKEVINPTSDQDIVAEGFVQNISVEDVYVRVDLAMPSASPSVAHEIELKVKEVLGRTEGVEKVEVNAKTRSTQAQTAQPPVGTLLEKVKNIIAISSAKGGVGKSTIAAQLALQLSRKGYQVGLLDADLYGPSLPTLFRMKEGRVSANEKGQMIPIKYNGIPLMSFGFLLGDQAAILRGPIVSRYVQQLLFNVVWGDLDYLLIDMPPGTGDVQLTITQSIRLTGAVIVTTPHSLSLVDVARGIIMFEKTEVPILGVLQNMAYFDMPDGSKQYPFGKPLTDIEDRFGVSSLAEIPILSSLSEGIGEQSPTCLKDAAEKLLQQSDRAKDKSQNIPYIKFDERKIQLSWDNGEHWVVGNRDLRLISQDALSVDEMTGRPLVKPDDIAQDIFAKEIIPLGNYGMGITWSDGHASAIYTYKNIRDIAQITTMA